MCSVPAIHDLPTWVVPARVLHAVGPQPWDEVDAAEWWQFPVRATAHPSLAYKTGAKQRRGARWPLFRAIRRMVSSLHSLAVG